MADAAFHCRGTGFSTESQTVQSFLAVSSQVLLALAGVFLMIVILLQRGRGGGLAGAFGGMGGQSAFGTKAGDVFTKITVIVALVWVVLAGGSGFFLRAASEQREQEFPSRDAGDDDSADADSTGDDSSNESATGTESGTSRGAGASDSGAATDAASSASRESSDTGADTDTGTDAPASDGATNGGDESTSASDAANEGT